MNEVSGKTQMAKIRGFEKGFMAIHLINVGAKVGVFEKLNEAKQEGLAVSDLAKELGLHEPYLKFWCQTAYHFEILDCDEQGRFKLQPFFDEILGDKNHFRNYLANIAIDVDIVGKGMVEAPEYLRSGEIIESYHEPEMSKIGYEATKNIYLAFLFMILPNNEHLKQMLDEGIKFLDIGCGNGSLIIQLAQAFANSKFVGVNPDIHGIEAAIKTISQMKLDERVSVENIGGQNLSYKNEFDMVCMVVTLHEIPTDVREKVVEKAYQTLKTGGYLLILDFPYPGKLEDFRNPMYDYGILDQFYEMCMGTVHLNMQEQEEMLSTAGFKDIRRAPVGKGMFEFVTAIKQ
jgi:ubiquinone/menaquinone biosynthesis C-methylase UbiE